MKRLLTIAAAIALLASAAHAGQPDTCYEDWFMQKIKSVENAKKKSRSKIAQLTPVYGRDNPYTNKEAGQCDYHAHFVDGSDQQITVHLKFRVEHLE
jgi:hypothetical protein